MYGMHRSMHAHIHCNSKLRTHAGHRSMACGHYALFCKVEAEHTAEQLFHEINNFDRF